MLDVLAREIRVTLELVAGEERTARTLLRDEHLAERGHDLARRLSGHAGIDRDLAPAQHREAFVRAWHLLDRACGSTLGVVGRQERDPGGVLAPAGGRSKVHDGPEERVGYLDRHARSVAGVGARRPRHAAVVQAAHRGERLAEDRVALAALHVHDEADAAACRARTEGRRDPSFRGGPRLRIARSRPRSRMVSSGVLRPESGHRGTTLARRRADGIVAAQTPDRSRDRTPPGSGRAVSGYRRRRGGGRLSKRSAPHCFGGGASCGADGGVVPRRARARMSAPSSSEKSETDTLRAPSLGEAGLHESQVDRGQPALRTPRR